MGRNYSHVLIPLISIHLPFSAYSSTAAAGMVQHASEYFCDDILI